MTNYWRDNQGWDSSFLNHLHDDKRSPPSGGQTPSFLNHLHDDKLTVTAIVHSPEFLNHLHDDKLELSQNKTLKNNNIKF